MGIGHRVRKLEQRTKLKRRCVVIIVLYRGDEGPTDEQVEQHREHRKKGGYCENCDGTCVLSWTKKASGGKPQWEI